MLLLVGPAGTGKTSTVKALARVLRLPVVEEPGRAGVHHIVDGEPVRWSKNGDALVVVEVRAMSQVDPTILWRFDDVLEYRLPDADDVAALIRSRLRHRIGPQWPWHALVTAAGGLAHADIVQACDAVVRVATLDQTSVSPEMVRDALVRRRGHIRETTIR